MDLDHVIYCAGPEGLMGTAERLGDALGVAAVPGGVHTTFGTRNALIPLARRQYLEVVAVDDAEVAAGHPFGSGVARATGLGGGWMGWAVRVDDPEPLAARHGREVIPGGRRRPDGVELSWRQVGTDVLTADPLLPFFLTWDVPDALHPAAGGPTDVTLESVTLRGGPDEAARLDAWLGGPLDGVRIDWADEPSWTTILQVTFTSRTASVTIR